MICKTRNSIEIKEVCSPNLSYLFYLNRLKVLIKITTLIIMTELGFIYSLDLTIHFSQNCFINKVIYMPRIKLRSS